ncbi:receptor-transporting protein 4-like [Echeneis naucrates]|uniref:Receptor-transporting protein 4-like n=1 Tax=Echeneis naucrates TaxID=173247 RepID=A0A665U0A0_ECHNA|nr:receptor-transporting protein 4-like [Echeneis naucrates]
MGTSTEWVPSLWLDIFDELLNDDNELDYGDQWTLNFNYNQTNDLTPEQRRRGWKISSCCTLGSFRCSSCSRTWSSARVTLVFHYRLRGERGTVIMRPFGQICRVCQSNNFELPGFKSETAKQNLLRLFSKIRKNCYGDDDDDGGTSPSCTQRWTKPHEKSLCEACQLGICCQEEEEDEED